jgi:hypothetical protein
MVNMQEERIYETISPVLAPYKVGRKAAAMDIIGVMNEAAEKPSAQIDQLDSDQDIELLLLASAGAIQRLIAERNSLRSRADAQECELTRLRHHVTLIPDSYRRLTTEFVTQFQLIDSAVSNFVGEPTEPPGPRLVEQE